MRKLFLSIAMCVSMVLTALPCSAQLLMEQSRVEETVAPGDTLIDSITLHNTSSQPMEISIYWEDFEYMPPFDGTKRFLPAGAGNYSMANWVSFSPKEMVIPPFEKRDVNYTIKVPRSASGGRYGVLFFERGSRSRPDRTGVSIVTRMGALFFLELIDKDKTCVIENIRLEDDQLKGIFTNQGNVIVFPEGIYYIMDEEGLAVERAKMEKIYLPPQKEASFAIDLDHDLKVGEYTLVLTFDLKDGQSVTKEVDFAKKTNGKFEVIEVRD